MKKYLVSYETKGFKRGLVKERKKTIVIYAKDKDHALTKFKGNNLLVDLDKVEVEEIK